MNTQTLEQTKDKIKLIEIKIEELQHVNSLNSKNKKFNFLFVIFQKKSELFSQLKKVLIEDTFLKKRPMFSQAEPILFQPVPYQSNI
jgi:hypothetical protein